MYNARGIRRRSKVPARESVASQSDIFEEIVTGNPALRSALAGFTFYPDTAGVAPTTILSMPAIHSGMEYDPSLTTNASYDAAVHKGSFLNDLARNGYRTTLVNPVRGVCPSEVLCTSTTALLGGTRASVQEEAAHLLDIALLRLTPLMLKPLVYNDGKWRIARLIRDERLMHPATKSNAVLVELAEKLAPVSERPTATFLHLIGTHLPVVLNERCQFVGETIPKTRESCKIQVRCALAALQQLLDALHREGLYDQTAIALLSDHGTSEMLNARGVPSPAGMNIPTMLGIADPTFAFKPFGANEPFHSTQAAISIADLPSIVCGKIGDCQRPSPPPGRERTFNYHAWKRAYARMPRIPNIVPYGITGSPMWAGSTWKQLEAE
ncbi:MAG: sulfatase-like hydrolase/transferase [Microvirga sp.]